MAWSPSPALMNDTSNGIIKSVHESLEAYTSIANASDGLVQIPANILMIQDGISGSFLARSTATVHDSRAEVYEHVSQLFARISRHDLLAFVGILLCLLNVTKWLSGMARSRRFHRWAKSQGCAPCAPLPRPFMASIRHKLHLLNAKGGDLLDSVFAEKYRKFGSTHALHDSFGVPRVVHTIDPVNVNAMLVKCFDDWKPSQSRTNTLWPLAQEGLLALDGHAWHHKRKMIQRFIGTNNAKDIKNAEKDVVMLFKAIGDADESGWTREVDLLELFRRMALDMSTTYLLGTCPEAQAKGMYEKEVQAVKEKYNLEDAKKVKSALTYDEAYEVVRNYYSWRAKLGSKYWLADGFEYRAACAVLTKYTDDLVAKAIEQSASSAGPRKSFGFIDRLATEVRDPVAIRDYIMDLFIAGQTMTGAMAAWVFAQLSAHPEVYQQLRQELVQTFGTESKPVAEVSWDRLRSCNLLQWCILETLRMYPLLPNLGRNAKVDTILPRGGGPDGSLPIAIPAGTAMTANVYLMHRRPEEWGEDAWDWKPQRWEGRKMGAEFAAFGAGGRVCIGQQLSITEISLVTARMLQRFDIMSSRDGQDNLTKSYRVAIAPKNGVKVRLHIAEA